METLFSMWLVQNVVSRVSAVPEEIVDRQFSTGVGEGRT
jgi:hypothetical protein